MKSSKRAQEPSKSPRRAQVVFGQVGAALDRGELAERWQHWRPTVSLCQHEDLLMDRFELLYQPSFERMARQVTEDLASVSPETEVRLHSVEFEDAWDFQDVYGVLYDFVRAYPFDPEHEDYLIHITTGTHVAQICWFLLAESRHLPGRLIQSAPPTRPGQPVSGSYRIIDLDLSRYDRIAQRHGQEQREGLSFLKAGIATRNPAFNRLIEQLERVALHSRDPLLLTGPTGAGKTLLARRIYELKKQRRQLEGRFVEINCATLRGDQAMSALFGHRRGAFTGAQQDRPGLLREADGGLLFLDEVGELGLDEQAMLLRAVEEGRFLPLGSDRESASTFQLICGTNRDLGPAVARGRFREDLLARIHLWTFRLPSLAERREDLEPNLDYELERAAARTGEQVRFSKEARERFVRFAHSPEARWTRNFRDLNAAVTRLATMAEAGRITVELVEEEIARLLAAWEELRPAEQGREAPWEELRPVGQSPETPREEPVRREKGPGPSAGASPAPGGDEELLEQVLGRERLAALDLFDQAQLATVVRVCRSSGSLSEAGRRLYAVSRSQRSTTNDSDRLRKYLARFGSSWAEVAGNGGAGPRP